MKTDDQARKYNDLSKQIDAVEKHLNDLRSAVKNGKAIKYGQIQTMNTAITQMMTRASNACWE